MMTERQTLWDMFPDADPTLREKFLTFHRENPHVYEMFCEKAEQLIRRGFRRYSSRTLFHVLRFHSDVETNDVVFKLNNNHTPYYARMWMDDHPEHPGFFDMRKVQEASDGE